MKWIVVVLVLLNVAAYLLGMKVDPQASQLVSAQQFEVINASAMSVIVPSEEDQAAGKFATSDGVALQEEGLAQLKVDKLGEVLMVPTRSTEEKPAKETGAVKTPVIVPNNLAKALRLIRRTLDDTLMVLGQNEG